MLPVFADFCDWLPFKPPRLPELDLLPASVKAIAGPLLDRVYWMGFKDGIVAAALAGVAIVLLVLLRRKQA
jgi:hypothetical protein